MIKTISVHLRTIFLFLALLGGSNISFASNLDFLDAVEKDNQQEVPDSAVGEQVDEHFDAILPFSKNPSFVTAGFFVAEEFDARISRHTFTSLSYIKRSCQIIPSMGVKEVIYPFHVFL